MVLENIEYLKLKVGSLMYIPALKKGVAEKLKNEEYQNLTSLAFCLEDSIVDSALEEAEKILKETLIEIKNNNQLESLPLIFIRVRNPEHLLKVFNLVKEELEVVTGFILPKFDLLTGEEFLKNTKFINTEYNIKTLYIMPILESEDIVSLGNRVSNLLKLKELIDGYKEYVLNLRVGANDLCNYYGLRRTINSTIYDIGVIKNILIDIITVFSSEYIVSGVVWEYFSDSKNLDYKLWSEGLEKELSLDRLNGFFGKTAIHPSQLPIIFNSLKVSRSDYEDAKSIIEWETTDLGLGLGVGKSKYSSRMNEVKCHTKWAKNIIILSEIYGIKEEMKY